MQVIFFAFIQLWWLFALLLDNCSSNQLRGSSLDTFKEISKGKLPTDVDIFIVDKLFDSSVRAKIQEIAVTAAPTEEPSEFPSFPNIADLTTAPTMQPTEIPVKSVPSFIPSFEPSLRTETPTRLFPTSQPSMRPSSEPSRQPSREPSLQPSGKPTRDPSAQPSRAPSSQPSSQPSQQPSREPTAQPSSRPTGQPSLSPIVWSVAPTPAPTIHPSPMPSQQSVGRCTAANGTLAIASYLNSTLFNFAYIEPGFMNFTKSMYLRSIANVTRTMQNLLVSNVPISITYLSLGASCSENGRSLYLNEQQVSCSDAQSVDFIWRSMMSARSFQTTCQGENWLAMYCSDEGLYRVCANCTQTEHCESTGINTAQQADIVGFALKPYPLTWPQWAQVVVDASFDSVIMQYNMSTSGTLTCAAIVSTSSAITTLAAISLSSNVLTATMANSNARGNLTFRGLRPDTMYEILCFTQGSDFNSKAYSTPTIADVYYRANYVRTDAAPLPAVVLKVPFVELVRGQISSAISVSLSFQPGKNISITPIAEYVSSSLCTGQSTVEDNFEPMNITVAPSKLSFPAYGTVTKKLFLQAGLVGCYRLRFGIASAAVNASSLVVTSSSSSTGGYGYYLNCTEHPSLPVVTISSIAYANTGVSVNLIFTSAIDLTTDSRFAMNFACDSVLNFTNAADCTCAFTSTTLLNIVLGASALLLPGDVVTVLPLRLKPRCPDGYTCDDISYLGALFGVVQNTVSVPAKASISTAPVVPLLGNITLDLLGSSGRGAGDFIVSWQVLHNGTIDTYAQRIQQRLNSGAMLWFGCVPMTFDCDTIPAQYLTASGTYSFVVTLSNFLGYSSSASAVVTVQSSGYIPSVRILGSSLSTISTSSSVALRALVAIDSGKCDGQPVEIAWVTYVNEQSVPLDNYAKDPRSLVIAKNTLTPKQLYTFQVNVFCGGNVAYAQTQLYVVASTPQIALMNDENTIVAASSPLTLNASLLASYNIYGASDFLVEWSCVQLQPLNEAGCLLFYQLMNLTQPINSFAVVGDILQPSSEYYINVQVSSSSLGVAITAGQLIEVLPDFGSDDNTGAVVSSFNSVNGDDDDIVTNSLPIVSAISTSLTAVADFGYTIQAIVSGGSMYAAVWQIANTNTTLSAAVFTGQGSQFFPAVISPVLAIIARQSPMTLQLSAFKITTSCNQLTCADSASIVSVSFPVSINQAPSGGLIATDPVIGNQDASFSIFASSWQDSDLPLSYAFYQAQQGENGGWSLIRQRMQSSFLITQLVISNTAPSNSTVPLQVCVADVLGATSSAETRVIWQALAEEPLNNVTTSLVTRTEAAAVIAAEIIMPELIFPYIAGIFATLTELSCFTASNNGKGKDCIGLVQAASVALLPSLSQFNDNAVILLGIAQYLEAFTSVLLTSSSLQARSWSVLTPLLEAYVYLTNSVVSVDLSNSDATDIMTTLLSTSQALASQLQLVSSEEDGTVTNITSSLVALRYGVIATSQAYFSLLPFGNSITFNSTNQSSVLFNVSLVKGYGHSGSSTGLQFSNEIFPGDGSTASYQLLQVTDLLVAGDCILESEDISKNASCAIIAGNVFVQFQFFSYYAQDETLLYLPFAVEPSFLNGLITTSNEEVSSTILMSVSGDPTVIVVNCSDSQALLTSVTCTGEMTGGDAYIFPPLINCPVNTSAVNFTCPRYHNEVGCFQDGYQVSIAISSESDASSVNCSYPVLAAESQQRVRQRRKLQSYAQSITSIASSIDIQSSFSVGKITRLISAPYVSLIPTTPGEIIVTPGSDDVIQSQSPAIPIYAVGIIIFFAGVAFFTIMYYKLKDFVERNPIMGEIPQTQAEVVDMPPVTNAAYLAIENGTDVGSSSSSSSDRISHSSTDDEEADIRCAAIAGLPTASLSDVQVIQIQAVALPLGIARRL